jgi:hypothetical protein
MGDHLQDAAQLARQYADTMLDCSEGERVGKNGRPIYEFCDEAVYGVFLQLFLDITDGELN